MATISPTDPATTAVSTRKQAKPARFTRVLGIVIGVLVIVALVVTIGLAAAAYLARGVEERALTSTEELPAAYTSEQYGYTVEFPGEPTQSVERQTVLGTELEMDMVEWDGGDEYATVGSIAIAEFLPADTDLAQIPAEQMQAMLQGSLDGAVANVEGAKLVHAEYGTLDGAQSIEGTMSTEEGLVDVVIAFRGSTSETLIIGGFTEEERNAFVDSFRFL